MNYPIDASAIGKSDKYGLVYVEKLGITGGHHERPVAVFHGDDKYAVDALEAYYSALCKADEAPEAQLESVRKQREAFYQWRAAHPERLRTPGLPR